MIFVVAFLKDWNSSNLYVCWSYYICHPKVLVTLALNWLFKGVLLNQITVFPSKYFILLVQFYVISRALVHHSFLSSLDLFRFYHRTIYRKLCIGNAVSPAHSWQVLAAFWWVTAYSCDFHWMLYRFPVILAEHDTIFQFGVLMWVFLWQFLELRELCTAPAPSTKLKMKMSSNLSCLLLCPLAFNWQPLSPNGTAEASQFLKAVSVLWRYHQICKWKEVLG